MSENPTPAPLRPIVRYERLFNLGNYENEKIGISVPVEDGETADQALARAQAFVADQRNQLARLEDMADRVGRLTSQVWQLQRLAQRYTQRYHELKEKLEQLGTEVPPLSPWDLPITDEELETLIHEIRGEPADAAE